MNQFQEQFYQMMTRLRENSGSRVAAVSEPREWYYDKNGVIVSKPIRYDMSIPSGSGTEQIYKCGAHDFETRDLIEFNRHKEGHEHSKAASVPSINKLKEIHNFINRRRY